MNYPYLRNIPTLKVISICQLIFNPKFDTIEKKRAVNLFFNYSRLIIKTSGQPVNPYFVLFFIVSPFSLVQVCIQSQLLLNLFTKYPKVTAMLCQFSLTVSNNPMKTGCNTLQ